MQILSNPIPALNVRELLKFSRLQGNWGHPRYDSTEYRV